MMENERKSSFDDSKLDELGFSKHSIETKFSTQRSLDSENFTSDLITAQKRGNRKEIQILSLKTVPDECMKDIWNQKGQLKSLATEQGKLSNNKNDKRSCFLLNGHQYQRSFSCKENILIKKLQQISANLKLKQSNNSKLASQSSQLQIISKQLSTDYKLLSERLLFYEAQHDKKQNELFEWNQTHNKTRQKLFKIFNKDTHQL